MEEIKEQITRIAEAVDAIRQNKPFPKLDCGGIFSELNTKINDLGDNIKELNVFIYDLANGRLETEIPSRRNYLAANAKQLHANLNHLTWQARQIARGDYSQRVDFIGEFSQSFNELTKQLCERENGLRARNEILQTVFNHVECLLIFSAERRDEPLYINKSAKSMFGVTDLGVEGCGFVKQLIDLDVEKESAYELFDADSKQWFEVVAIRLNWLNDSSAILFYCVNITVHKKKQYELESKAFTDPLTGVSNRRYLELYMSELINTAIHERLNITCFMADVDNFKRLNDTYGHLQGDACLVAMANCLKSLFIRSTDFVARYGGEEFLIVSQGMTPEAALAFAEKLRKRVESQEIPLVENPLVRIGVTISIGVCSLVPTPKTLPENYIALADSALYKSKNRGKNRVTLCETLTLSEESHDERIC